MNRRTFIKSSAAATLGGIYLVNATGCGEGEERPMEETMEVEAPATGRALERIGVQLYTVRSLMENDVAGTLEQVAAVGYDEVEFAGYFEHSPAEIRSLLDQFGLAAPAAHIGIDRLRNELGKVLEEAQTVGHRYVICPWLAEDQRTLDAYKGHAAFFNEVGAACKEAGIQFAYHNHDFEFEMTDGMMPYDLLLDETDADLVQMELDLYWITKGGHDPLAYFERYPGRFTLCHAKDMDDGQTIVPVGEGTIDFGRIFAQSEQAGLVHYFVEHDHPDDPMASIAASYNHLKELRF